MNANDYLPVSPKLRPEDLPGDVSYTIARVGTDSYTGDDGKTDTFLTLFFRETDKFLKVGKKSNQTMQAMFGPDTDNWIGKQVTLMIDEFNNKGTMTEFIKIRKFNYSRVQQAANMAPGAAPNPPYNPGAPTMATNGMPATQQVREQVQQQAAAPSTVAQGVPPQLQGQSAGAPGELNALPWEEQG